MSNSIVSIAENEVGYLEKASNSLLDDKTANAGKNNWTKYGRWYGQYNGYAWCAMFVSWCADQAGVKTDVIPKFHSCTAGKNWFKRNGCWKARSGYTPEPGDIIFFGSSSSKAEHVGIVREVKNSRVYTVEGNTSGGSTVIVNGGGVAAKNYSLSESKILGYGCPNYEGSKIAAYKDTIQKRCNFSNPDGVFSLTDKSPWAEDLYRKWAESYD